MQSHIKQFISWWHRTAPETPNSLPPLNRVSIAHLYFVCIHPFEDGNVRIARVLVEKALSDALGKPTLIALSQAIERNKNQYYVKLENNNKNDAMKLFKDFRGREPDIEPLLNRRGLK